MLFQTWLEKLYASKHQTGLWDFLPKDAQILEWIDFGAKNKLSKITKTSMIGFY